MKHNYAHFWAKANKTDYHSILHHAVDVYYVAKLLLDLNNTTRWVEALKQIFYDDPDADQNLDFIPYFSGVHDVGKLIIDFQFIRPEHMEKIKNAGYKTTVFLEIEKQNIRHEKISAISIPEVLGNLQKGDSWMTIVQNCYAGHHGNFVENTDLKVVRGYTSLEPQEWKDLRHDLFFDFANLVGFDLNFTALKPNNISTATTALAGFMVLCDWIASDVKDFPYSNLPIEQYMEVSKNRAYQALDGVGFFAKEADIGNQFKDLFPEIKKRRPLQKVIDRIPEEMLKTPSITIIEAMTGEGKTEAALYIAHRISKLIGRYSIAFALPTMATSNAMYPRTDKHLVINRQSEQKTRLVHGMNSQNTEYSDHLDETREDWYINRRKALLAAITVGTIDQLQLSVLNTKYFFVRLLASAGKIIILDEVHAYDVYMSDVVGLCLHYFRLFGAWVIVLSATLPQSKRDALLRAYGAKTPDPKSELGKNRPYPIVITANSEKIVHYLPAPKNAKRKVILTPTYYGATETYAYANKVVEILKKGGRVCVFRNTVARTQEFYQAIKKLIDKEKDFDATVILTHSRFLMKTRVKKDQLLLDICGKNSTFDHRKDKPILVIATQVAEQSLDIDFDVMFTDICPIDILLQRAGRLHRFTLPISRMNCHRKPRIYVNIPLDEQLRPNMEIDSLIYSEYVLLKTLQVLDGKPFISISDYRAMIEDVYEEGVVPTNAVLRKAYDELQKDIEISKKMAQLLTIGKPDKDEFFNPQVRKLDNSEEITMQGLTRLGEKNVEFLVLIREGNEVLIKDDADGKVYRLNVNQKPNKDMVNLLLQYRIRVNKKSIVECAEIAEIAQKKERPLFLDNLPTSAVLPKMFEHGALKWFQPVWIDREGNPLLKYNGVEYPMHYCKELGLVFD